jgi:hypothetical protein
MTPENYMVSMVSMVFPSVLRKGGYMSTEGNTVLTMSTMRTSE